MFHSKLPKKIAIIEDFTLTKVSEEFSKNLFSDVNK